MHQFELDLQLADGADPASSPALQTRAHQLQAIHCRRRLVVEIDAALAKAEHPPHWHSVRLPVRTPDVRAARDALLALRHALAAGEEPCVPGLALASCLLNDLQGPLYRPCPGGDVVQLADRPGRLWPPTNDSVWVRAAVVSCRCNPFALSTAQVVPGSGEPAGVELALGRQAGA